MENTDLPDISRDSDKFMLRLPDGMRARIAEVAKGNGRSMNTEIVTRLQESFGPNLASLSWEDLVEHLQDRAATRGAVVTITIS